MATETAPFRFSVGMGFLISLTREKALAYPVYAKMMLTIATERSLPLSVVPSKALRKFAFGSGMRWTLPPKTTNPVMLMLYSWG